MSKRLLTLAFVAALFAGACSQIPQGTVATGTGVRFIPYVADTYDNAGLGNQVTVNKDGVPYTSYLIFKAAPTTGSIPIARPIGAPYISTAATSDTPAKDGGAVGVASLADNGIWTRGAAAQVRDTPQGIVVPYGPATVPSLIGASATTTNGSGIAIDDTGAFHVVWTGDDGIYYANAPSTGGFTAEEIYKYGSTLDVAGPMSRPSVAVDADGNPWVAYALLTTKFEVDVATKDANGKWITTTVATADACNGCPQPRAPRIAVTPDGPIVSWIDSASHSVMAARLKGTTWTTEAVASDAQYGLDMAVGKDGTVLMSFYSTDSAMLASSTASGWTEAKVGGATPPAAQLPPCTPPSASPSAEAGAGASAAPSGSPAPTAAPAAPLPADFTGNCELTTGVAADDNGQVYVTWYDGTSNSVILASGDGSKFTVIQTQGTEGGAYPSLAVRGDGSQIYVSWYGVKNQDLRMGVQGDTASLAVAVPSPTPSVPPVTSGPACGEDGKIALNEVAQGTAFKDACLVAPAGKDFSILFDNQDPVAATGQHNIAIATDQAGTDVLFAGELVSGPAKVTYDVTAKSGPLDAGTYFFHCQVHPVMAGTLAVVKVK